MLVEPLRLPPSLKRIGRRVRDHRITNRLITRGLKALLPQSRLDWAAHRAPVLGEFSVPLPNSCQMRLHAERAELVHSLIFYRDWAGDEPETLPIWFDLAQTARTIIDVGAHIGHFTITAALANKKATVHAFEPHPVVRQVLERNIALNGLSNVKVHAEALGRTDGKASFFAYPNSVPSSSSLSEAFMLAGNAELEEIPVTVARLDSILSQIDGPVLLKIDTETTEPDVLAGAAKLIARHQPTIILEVLAEHDTGAAVEMALPGYTPFLITGEGLVKATKIKGHPRWRNYLLRP